MNKASLLIGTVLILAIFLGMSIPYAQSMGGGMMGGGGHGIFTHWGGNQGWGMGPGMMGLGYGMGWFGTIIMAAFWIAVIVGIVLLIRWLVVSTRTEGHKAQPKDSSWEILKTRYAKGEIDKKEFEEKKKDLFA